MRILKHILFYISAQWAALLWTIIGVLSLHPCWMLLRRWLPAYKYFKTQGSEASFKYARRRLRKTFIVTGMGMLVISLGAIVLLGPAGQGNAPTWRSYVFIGTFLLIDLGIYGLGWNMNQEDIEQGNYPIAQLSDQERPKKA